MRVVKLGNAFFEVPYADICQRVAVTKKMMKEPLRGGLLLGNEAMRTARRLAREYTLAESGYQQLTIFAIFSGQLKVS